MEQQELDLLSIFRVLRRRIWLILALPAVAAVTAGIISFFFLTPIYSASTTLWVIKEGSEQITLSDVQLSRNLTQTYAEVAKSRVVMLDVIEHLQIKEVPVKELQDKLTVTPVRNTEILSFTIEDESPVMAARLADAVAEAFKGQILTFMQLENVVVVDPAVVPNGPIKPRKLMNVLLAGILGGMAAVGLVFLLEFLDTSIKSPGDVTQYVGLPVLGMIPVIEPKETEPAPRRIKGRQRSSRTAVEP